VYSEVNSFKVRFFTIYLSYMYQQRILICMPAPIIGIGLQVQFYNWGFTQVDLVLDIEKAMESVQSHTPTLLVLDAGWPNTEQTFTLIQQVRRNNTNIPVIFLSKHDEQTLGWAAQLQWLSPYRWLSKPPHIEDVWQAVQSLVPNINRSSGQG
jgi:DNA-binding response OmpR family regulator